MHPNDHPATVYANGVADGSIIAGRLVRLAAERHLNDLETGRDRGWRFDTQRGMRPINFAKMFRHKKGFLKGKPFEPLPWQSFVFGCCFGWVSEETGYRRFRIAYNQVAKKNGKTTMAEVPAGYGLIMDDEGAPEVYAVAAARHQAGILFKGLKSSLRASAFGPLIDITTYEINCPASGGVAKALSRDSDTADGLHPHINIIDEVHRLPDGDLPEILRESMIGRTQPLQWMITTAGESLASYCGVQREYSERILTGRDQDDEYFAFITEPDVTGEIDICDERLHREANPSIDAAFPAVELMKKAHRALAVPSTIPAYKRFSLNLWTAGGETWLPDDVWMRNYDEKLTIEAFKGRKCWGGLDLSATTDTTAFVIACPLDDGRIALWRWIWLPEDRLVENGDRDKIDYTGYHESGLLDATPGDVVDYEFVLDRLKWVADFVDLQEIAADPAMLKNLLNQDGVDALPLRQHGQKTMEMSPPMKELERRAHRAELAHKGDALMRNQISSVVVSPDAAGNIYPNKKKANGRIDAPVSAIMAVGRAVDQGGIGTVIPEDYWSYDN